MVAAVSTLIFQFLKHTIGKDGV